MKIKINKAIGKTSVQFEIEKESEMEALFLTGFLASTPTKCNCGSEDVEFTSNKAKGYMFVKVACKKCNAVSQLGQYKDGGFFWKNWEIYNPSPAGSEEVPTVEQE